MPASLEFTTLPHHAFVSYHIFPLQLYHYQSATLHTHLGLRSWLPNLRTYHLLLHPLHHTWSVPRGSLELDSHRRLCVCIPFGAVCDAHIRRCDQPHARLRSRGQRMESQALFPCEFLIITSIRAIHTDVLTYTSHIQLRVIITCHAAAFVIFIMKKDSGHFDTREASYLLRLAMHAILGHFFLEIAALRDMETKIAVSSMFSLSYIVHRS